MAETFTSMGAAACNWAARAWVALAPAGLPGVLGVISAFPDFPHWVWLEGDPTEFLVDHHLGHAAQFLQLGGLEDEDLEHAHELCGLNAALDDETSDLALGELAGQGRCVKALPLCGSPIQEELPPEAAMCSEG